MPRMCSFAISLFGLLINFICKRANHKIWRHVSTCNVVWYATKNRFNCNIIYSPIEKPIQVKYTAQT